MFDYILTKYGEDWSNNKEKATVFLESKMESAAISISTLPIEPPVWESILFIVTSNQKCNFCGIFLTLRDARLMLSLLSRTPVIERFLLKIGKVQSNMGRNFGFWGQRPPWSGFEGFKVWKGTCMYLARYVIWAIQRATWSVIVTCK